MAGQAPITMVVSRGRVRLIEVQLEPELVVGPLNFIGGLAERRLMRAANSRVIGPISMSMRSVVLDMVAPHT